MDFNSRGNEIEKKRKGKRKSAIWKTRSWIFLFFLYFCFVIRLFRTFAVFFFLKSILLYHLNIFFSFLLISVFFSVSLDKNVC